MRHRPYRRARAAHALLVAMCMGAASVVEAATVFESDAAHFDIYGILDAGLGYLEHSWAASDVFASTINPYNLNAAPHSFTGLYTGGISMSRVGTSGELTFGDGDRVFFRLETAVNVTSGMLSDNGQAIDNNIYVLHTANAASAIDGQWDSRAAYLGVSDPRWGSLQGGRTTNFSFDQVVEYDPVQAALLYSPLGFSGGIGGGLGATENSRLDESLKYQNRLAGVDFGLQYKFKGDQSAQSAGYAWVAMLGYGSGPLSLKGTVAETTNSVVWPVQYSNVTPPGQSLQIENTKGYMLSAMYKSGSVTLKAGYEDLEVYAPSNPGLTGIQDYFGIAVPKPATNATGRQYFQVWWLGGDYRFTPRLDLAAGVYDVDTYNNPELNKQYLALGCSLLADYNFTRRFDAYFGAMLMQYSGVGLDNRAPVIAHSRNALYGVGIRFRF
ncbi:MAG TPA: porin [Steroidobacteraceae bacterium]|nr:porin [Steroidobacteraceae bacterium]